LVPLSLLLFVRFFTKIVQKKEQISEFDKQAYAHKTRKYAPNMTNESVYLYHLFIN
jgi:hypothetical protein